VTDGRTPNLVESRVIWQGLLEYGRLEWQKTVKKQHDQEIKILENLDRVWAPDHLVCAHDGAINYLVAVPIFGSLCDSD